MAITLKELLEGQQRLIEKEAAPERVTKEQLAGLMTHVSGTGASQAEPNKVIKLFETFISQTRRREELLQDATDKQKEIFHKLESTIKDLKLSNSTDSAAMRKVLNSLKVDLKATPQTKARAALESMITPMARAQRGQQQKALNQSVQNYISNRNIYTTNNIKNMQAAAASPMAPALYEDSSYTGSENLETPELSRIIAKSIIDPEATGAGIDVDLPWMGSDKKTAKGKTRGRGKVVPPVLGEPEAKTRTPQARDKRGRFKRVSPLQRTLSKIRPGALGLGLTGIGLDYAAEKVGTDTKLGASLGILGSTAEYAGLGATIGSFIPGVGTAIGGVIGGTIGLGTGLYEHGKTFLSRPEAVAQPQTKKIDSTIHDQSSTYNMLRYNTQQPVVINNVNPTPAAPLQQKEIQQFIVPRGDIRPSESSLNRWMNRTSSFV